MNIKKYCNLLRKSNNEVNLNFLEIGARGNVKDFHNFETIINYYGFEPDIVAFSKKQALLAEVPFAKVKLFCEGVCTETQYKQGPCFLNVTSHEGCSSLLEPNFDLIREFAGYRHGDPNKAFKDNFSIKETTPISARCLHHFFPEGLSRPDIIQIDIQGLEIDILRESEIINDCILIDIELEVLELYKDQVLLKEALSFFEEKGYSLVRLYNIVEAPRRPMSKWNYVDRGEIVSVDAIFVRFPGLDFLEILKFSLTVNFYGFHSLALHYLMKLDGEVLSSENRLLIDELKKIILRRYRNLNFFGGIYLRFTLFLRRVKNFKLRSFIIRRICKL